MHQLWLQSDGERDGRLFGVWDESMSRLRGRAARRVSRAGLLASAIIVIAFLVSLKWGYSYTPRRSVYSGMPISGVGCSDGVLLLIFGGPFTVRWHWGHKIGPSFLSWRLWYPKSAFEGSVGLLIIPLWMPFLVVFVPSLILLWRSRPPNPGHCPNCDYDLTGNVSGVCPECGTKIEASVGEGEYR